MHWIDWTIMGSVVTVLGLFAFYTQRHTKSVADFLSANRCAGRYLLMMATQMSAFSAIWVVGAFEQYYQAGFCANWWSQILVPIGLVIVWSGYIVYRFRETRAMTMAQFLEIRYSRRFRIFTGILAYVAGVMNYGIFPAVSSRFFIYFCGFPHSFELFGIEIPTFACVMLITLSAALFITISGGQLTVMVTDFLQGQFTNVVFLIILAFIFLHFGWDNIIDTLIAKSPVGQSRVNPFNQQDVPDFNVWYFVLAGALMFYQHMVWQGSQGYLSSAKNPHEARMAGILSAFVGWGRAAMIMLLPLCVFVVLHNADYSQDAAAVQSVLSEIPAEQIRTQMRVPVTLAQIFPIGIMGLFATMMLAATIANDDTQLHSWGSILLQDVVLPFRKKPLAPKKHLKMLRISIFTTAVLIYVFSLLFPLREFIFMWLQISGAIFTGGAGCAIIGGLYWKRGTTAGAWCGIITGCIFAAIGMVWRNILPNIPALADIVPQLPLNGIQVAFVVSLMAIIVYVSVSLITCKEPYNIERMLHRGKYAIEGDHKAIDKKVSFFHKIIGMGKEFTFWDKVIYLGSIIITLVIFVAFLLGSAYGMTFKTSELGWSKYWLCIIAVFSIGGLLITIWYIIGGTRDLIELFRTLKTKKRDDWDDGTVIGHHSRVDEEILKEVKEELE